MESFCKVRHISCCLLKNGSQLSRDSVQHCLLFGKTSDLADFFSFSGNKVPHVQNSCGLLSSLLSGHIIALLDLVRPVSCIDFGGQLKQKKSS